MKAILLDTSVLLRERHAGDVHHAVVVKALESFALGGWTVYVTPQCSQEYWSVATRPSEARGGLGLSVERAAEDLRQILLAHDFLPEPPQLFEAWREVVSTYRVVGRQVWDARIAALLRLYGIGHLLTFNTADFQQFPFLRAWSPGEVERLLEQIE